MIYMMNIYNIKILFQNVVTKSKCDKKNDVRQNYVITSFEYKLLSQITVTNCVHKLRSQISVTNYCHKLLS